MDGARPAVDEPGGAGDRYAVLLGLGSKLDPPREWPGGAGETAAVFGLISLPSYSRTLAPLGRLTEMGMATAASP